MAEQAGREDYKKETERVFRKKKVMEDRTETTIEKTDKHEEDVKQEKADKKKKKEEKKAAKPEKSSAGKLAQLLIEGDLSLATAESCTGGLVAAKLTSVPGVSAVYRGGFVTYATDEKKKMLGVSKKVLKELGAVSKKTAKQMAKGAAEKTGSDCAISVTGNAGPDVMEDKPAGLVYIGYVIDGEAGAKEYHFEGDRDAVREQAAEAALKLLYKKLKKEGESESPYEKITDDDDDKKSGAKKDKKDKKGKEAKEKSDKAVKKSADKKKKQSGSKAKVKEAKDKSTTAKKEDKSAKKAAKKNG